MRTLWLLRHAKSAWDDPTVSDHDRALAPRGVRATGRLARHAAREGIQPDLVLCSSAVRARATLAPLAAALGNPPVTVERQLYAATAPRLLDRLRALPPEVGDVLIVGHDPGLQELVATLARPSPLAARVAAKLPTGGLVTLELAGAWDELAPACAEVVALVVPRELGD